MRIAILVVCALVFAAFAVPALLELPDVGDYPGPYGDVVIPVSLHERHTTNVTGAVAYDIRGFDTLIEEFIFVAAVVGVRLLMRPANGKSERKHEPADQRPAGPAVRWISADALAVTLLFGGYMTVHATQTPGGGFQGGAVIASAILLVYLAWHYTLWSTLARDTWLALLKAGGVLLFLLVGLVPLVQGKAFLANWIPLGTTGEFGSGGTMFVINIGISLAVAGGFALIANELVRDLDQKEHG